MAFPTRNSKETTSIDECSEQLMANQTTNTVRPYYDTFHAAKPKLMNRNSVSQPVTPTEPNKLKPKFNTHRVTENIPDSPWPGGPAPSAGIFPYAKIRRKSSKYNENTPKHNIMSLVESRETSYSKDSSQEESLQHSDGTNTDNLAQYRSSARSSPFFNRSKPITSAAAHEDEPMNEENNDSSKLKHIGLKIRTRLTRTRSNSNTILVSFNKLRNNKGVSHSPGSKSQYLVGYRDANHTPVSIKSGTTATSIPLRQRARLLLKGKVRSDTMDLPRIKTTREGNKKFIFERLQQDAVQASLYHAYHQPGAGAGADTNAASTVASGHSFSLDETEYQMVTERPIDYNYAYRTSTKTKKASLASTMTQKTGPHSVPNETTGLNSRRQLVYIGGIDERNKYDVRDRLFDLFEMWGDTPNILWNNDCLYVRFPSIKSAMDGINVFDGEQPNGYSLCAELVLEGSQMVYIDGLDGDWNEEIFKNFVEIPNQYKVSIKRISDHTAGSDKAYAFVQFQSLEAVQSAIDTFDAETEIDGKLVRWEHMVKAYVGKIGGDVTVKDIQKELSEFDSSFEHLPIDIRKSREPIYYDSNNELNNEIVPSPTAPMTDIQKMNIGSPENTQPNIISSDVETESPAMILALSPKSGSSSNSLREVNANTLQLNAMEENKEQIVKHNPLQKKSDTESMNNAPPIIYDGIDTTHKQSVEEEKSATPMPISQPALGLFEMSGYHLLANAPMLKSQSFGKQISSNSNSLNTPQPTSPKFSIVSSNHTSQSIGDESKSTDYDYEYECEWHYYAYIWFFNKYDAMRAQTRFDHRNCFGSNHTPIRFLLMNDMTQKVYVSGLSKGHTNKETIERDITRGIPDTDLWRKQCIVTYRNNEERPFAYLRFPSLETTNEAIQLFDNKICFGNRGNQRIHLERVKEENDLLCHPIGRKWNKSRYCYLTLSFVFLPLCLTWQWVLQCLKYTSNANGVIMSETAKELARHDLLSALLCFNASIKEALARGNCLYRWVLIILSYALYFAFYLLFTIYTDAKTFTALIPMVLYWIIIQLFCIWCCLDLKAAYPQFHVLEHVSMYFEDSVVYSRIHVTASDFAASKNWNAIIYPWDYPIEWNKRMVIPAVIYPLLSRYGTSPFRLSLDDINPWIELLAAVLMFCFCFILFCVFDTITSRILSYWKEVRHITDLITLKSNLYHANGSLAFLKLDSENNLFAWLSLRSFIHRKGCVVFCGLEIHSLFLVVIIVLNLVSIIIGILEWSVSLWVIIQNQLIFCQTWFLCVSIYYLSYVLMIGYWFGKENQNQLNRVERHKLFIYTERMKQVLNQEKYKLIDNTKIIHLKLLLNSMEALVQHVQTKEITPRLWGIKLNDFSGKVAMMVVAAVLPSMLVRWLLNVS